MKIIIINYIPIIFPSDFDLFHRFCSLQPGLPAMLTLLPEREATGRKQEKEGGNGKMVGCVGWRMENGLNLYYILRWRH